MKFNFDKQKLEQITKDELIRIIYSQWDMQQALSALTFLLEDCDFEQKYSRAEIRKFMCYEANLIISFSRPFIQSRGKSILNLKKMGISLSESDKLNQAKLLGARNKLIAHSDEEFMHFKVSNSKPLDDVELLMPHVIYDEGLFFNYDELLEFEIFFRSFKNCIAEFMFRYTQIRPDLMNFYKVRQKTTAA